MLIIAIGVILVGLGIWAQIRIQKRNFERNNAAGVQEFADFGQSYRFGLMNRTLKIVSVSGITIGAIVLGIGVMVFSA